MEYILLVISVAILALSVILLLKKPKEMDTKAIEDAVRKAMGELQSSILNENRLLREELEQRLDRTRNSLVNTLMDTREVQQKSLGDFSSRTGESLEGIRSKVDERLEKIQAEFKTEFGTLLTSNEKKLDQMRQTVNEKLEKTLETRLQKSFETVSTQLESVNKGLGEMKTVAESVGSLNKVLSGAKTRGILGELQLGKIIEDMLPSQSYEVEVPTISGSRERVEYAIKFPGAEDGKHVYLPIDSKFPLEDYYRLIDGYESGDTALVEASRKALLDRIKLFAKDVVRKYVSPPETTNFAVIFLPTEGLYSEVVRDATFLDDLRREGVIATGPSTLSAMLNSLQLGFKTLQIQKGAADIERKLGAVKKEFDKFETVLTKARTRVRQAGEELDALAGTRTRAINRSLKDVQTYTGEDSQELLGIGENPGFDDFEDEED
ncbi:MAG: DNA recombination protein RmuC [Oscillospiraceae bacterium]|nr:DNA recombination protein RmuC [Oscillospiraceae bacterium]